MIFLRYINFLVIHMVNKHKMISDIYIFWRRSQPPDSLHVSL